MVIEGGLFNAEDKRSETEDQGTGASMGSPAMDSRSSRPRKDARSCTRSAATSMSSVRIQNVAGLFCFGTILM